jgi:hypothetical protein
MDISARHHHARQLVGSFMERACCDIDLNTVVALQCYGFTARQRNSLVVAFIVVISKMFSGISM